MEYKSKACIVETDLEALNIGVNSEKKSIEVLSQISSWWKENEWSCSFQPPLNIEEKKYLVVSEEMEHTLIQERAYLRGNDNLLLYVI